jgi:hypothetical protein
MTHLPLPPAQAEVVETVGMRAVLGMIVLMFPRSGRAAPPAPHPHATIRGRILCGMRAALGVLPGRSVLTVGEACGGKPLILAGVPPRPQRVGERRG